MSKRVVIELDSDTDEELPPKKIKTVDAVPPPRTGIAGLTAEERRELEEARAARAAAAVASGARSVVPVASASRAAPVATLGSSATQNNNTSAGARLEFPEPTVRRNFSRYYPSDKRALSMGQILGDKKTIRSMVSAAFCNDLDWLLLDAFEGIRDVTLLCQPSGQTGTFPVMPGVDHFRLHFAPITSTFHVKFFLIFREHSTRVVILSANNVSYDHDTIENAIWLQDFPVRATDSTVNSFAMSNFGKVWTGMLSKCQLAERYWRPQMDATNFGDVDSYCRLVLSWPEPNMYDLGSTAIGTGYRMLAKQVRDLGAVPPKKHSLAVEYNTSSCSAYTHDWLEAFYASLIGVEPPSRKRFASAAEVPIRLVFPSLKTVKESKGGPDGGGTLFFEFYMWKKKQGSTWVHNDFALANLRDGISQRPGVLQHTKTIIALFKPEKGAETLKGKQTRGWAYVGSHNMSTSAWGRVKKGKLEVPNAEFGIIFRLEGETDEEVDRKATEIATWARPVKKYEPDEKGRPGEPWMQKSFFKEGNDRGTFKKH